MKKINKRPTLMTEYSEKMDKSAPWNEYPRPSLVRKSYFSLNGEWDFAVTDGKTPEKYDKILVPFPPESELSGLNINIPKGSLLHYKRCFTLPQDFNVGRVILHFGAVDAECEIFLNGCSILKHEGGYLPFSADITDKLSDENTLTVFVKDDIDTKYPYGKQTHKRGGMWYTPVSGIWQSVWIESVPESYVKRLKITPTVNSVKIEVVGGDNLKTLTLLDSGEVYNFEGDEIVITPRDVHCWSPESPYLYRFKIECGKDTLESYFALREICTKKVNGIARLCLNGTPYLFNGLLDQGYFPDGLFLPATSQGYYDDIALAKEMGFNMLRKHIKIEPEVFYYLCDKLGMVVFQDMVNNSDYSFIRDTVMPTVGFKHKLPFFNPHKNPINRRIFEENMLATIDHLHNFPSVLYYTIFNEGWGQFSADEMYEKAKSHDPTRIFDATSGWFWEKKSDVDSRHVYFKKVRLGKVTDRPIVISEFGGYAHRVANHVFGDDLYGYKNFVSREDFENAFLRLYRDEIAPLIPLGISALVYTQISDVEDETNGITTYDRRVIKLDKVKTRETMQKLYNAINPQKEE